MTDLTFARGEDIRVAIELSPPENADVGLSPLRRLATGRTTFKGDEVDLAQFVYEGVDAQRRHVFAIPAAMAADLVDGAYAFTATGVIGSQTCDLGTCVVRLVPSR